MEIIRVDFHSFRIEPMLVRLQLKYSLIIDFRAGFFDFSFVSISNVLSAWFQYEALKLVNFTTVVLFKGSRILPVMIMGRIISKTKNSAFDWITAVLLCVGSVMFMVSKDINTDNKGYENIISGIVCLILYVTFGQFSQKNETFECVTSSSKFLKNVF